MKKVLVLCTGNSCRSIIAEALINAELDGVKGFSSGVKPSGRVNINAIKVLEDHGIWDNKYHSKTLKSVLGEKFDLVVTVCDNAKENCPVFHEPIKVFHMPFSDPDGKEYQAFEETYKKIKEELLPKVMKELGL